jgi:hypothetical protein
MLRTSFITFIVALTTSSALAQTVPPLHRLQLAGGIGFLSGAGLGDADANLRSATSNDPYRLFATSSELANTTALDLRAAVDLTRRFGLEAHALYGHPELQTSVTGDVENAPSLTAVERLDHYLIDGGVVVMLDELRVAGWQPFAVGGAGYLRQLHEGLLQTEEGHLFYVGGGARRLLTSRNKGFLRGLGARGDVRWNILSGGITVEDKTRNQIAVSGSVFVVF